MKLNTQFDTHLEELKMEIDVMVALCRENLVAISQSLRSANSKLLVNVPKRSLEIDHCEHDIESLCLRLLLKQHPVASDLRTVSAALKAVTDLQRIGHQSADVAEIILAEPPSQSDHLTTLTKMSECAITMLDLAIEAERNNDATLARKTIITDNTMDTIYSELRSHIAIAIRDHMTVDPEQLLNLLMIGKYLERMADHMVIFARWTLFRITGDRVSE